jgi:hypothetical protein
LVGLAAAFALIAAASIAVAAAHWCWPLVGACAVSAALEIGLFAASGAQPNALSRGGFGRSTRVALSFVAIVLLAAGHLEGSVVNGVAITGLVVVLASAAFVDVDLISIKLHQPPLAYRAPGSLRPRPSTAMRLSASPAVGPVSALICALGVAADYGQRGISAVVTALAVAAAAALLPLAATVGAIATALRRKDRDRATAEANKQIGALAPEVVIYFDASVAELYQLRQWVEPVRRLERPALILLRRHASFEALGEVGLPVAVSPYNGVLAALPLPERTVVLFVTHTGNNLSMIGRLDTRTAFVGHGDSDKADSINRFARVYDEVWVAGPLGRRRYAEADLEVRDDAIVEVGRPQLSVVPSSPPQPPVVLYAPTWEGWGDDAHHSSLGHIGVRLVESLIAQGLRVHYRPHPLTGKRDADLRAANAAIAAMASAGKLTVAPAAETLEQSFALASGLVTDVSSVIIEWLVFDRPYAVADTRGLGSAAFRERFPSVSGGFILEADIGGLEEFVATVTGAADPTSAARHALTLDALGDPATSQQRFADAVERLLTR